MGPVAQASQDLGLGRPTGWTFRSNRRGWSPAPDQKYRLWQERRSDWCAAADAGYPELRRTDPVTADYYPRWTRRTAVRASCGAKATPSTPRSDRATVTTPLQLAVAYSAIANGGTVWQPTIGRALIDRAGTVRREIDPRSVGSVAGDRRYSPFPGAQSSCGDGIRNGGRRFRGFPLDRIPVAGKTGSAQVEGHNSTSWFASFAPANDPSTRWLSWSLTGRRRRDGSTCHPGDLRIPVRCGAEGRVPIIGTTDDSPEIRGIGR